MQIPDIQDYKLKPAVRSRVERAVKGLHGNDRYNEYKIINRMVDDFDRDFGEPSDYNYKYDIEVESLGLTKTSDIHKAVWSFFNEFHQGKFNNVEKLGNM